MADEDEELGPLPVKVSQITVIRTLVDVYGKTDFVDVVEAIDANGDDLPLHEALGMLRLAEDTLIRDAMGES